MFTPPQISTNDNLDSRSFIYFYHNNKRYKFYNGRRIKSNLFPNHAKTIKVRNTLLEQLKFEYHKALSNGWNPAEEEEKQEIITVRSGFTSILNEKLSSPYSRFYKRDLQKLYDQFFDHIPDDLLDKDVKSIPQSIIEQFLNQFRSSATHYMNKRRSLSMFFSELVRQDYLSKNPITKTSKQRVKAKLHDIYTEKQLKSILEFLKLNYYNLYLCCLITYGCLLRPHQEIRHLKLKHINEDFTSINLSGNENKSGKIRKVYIPAYLQTELKGRLNGIEDLETNIFTLDNKASFNDDYFKTQWSRAKTEMLKLNLVLKNQTLYSFRHTAVVNVYRKTKDLHILQQLLQHSNMVVTLNYLRGLGEVNDEQLRNSMPEL